MKTRDESYHDFWDAICRNIDWEGLEFNDGHHLRIITPTRTFDFWPKHRKIMRVKPYSKVVIVPDNINIDDFIKWNLT